MTVGPDPALHGRGADGTTHGGTTTAGGDRRRQVRTGRRDTLLAPTVRLNHGTRWDSARSRVADVAGLPRVECPARIPAGRARGRGLLWRAVVSPLDTDVHAG